jgi:hypothetical protein
LSAANVAKTSFWTKFVLKDVDGAFEGGAAAVAIAPAMVSLFSVPLAAAAAFGVVVVVGVRASDEKLDLISSASQQLCCHRIAAGGAST